MPTQSWPTTSFSFPFSNPGCGCSLQTVEINAGDFFTVDVLATNIPDFFSISLDIVYDPDALQIVGGPLGIDRGTLFVHKEEGERLQYLDWAPPLGRSRGRRGCHRWQSSSSGPAAEGLGNGSHHTLSGKARGNEYAHLHQ